MKRSVFFMVSMLFLLLSAGCAQVASVFSENEPIELELPTTPTSPVDEPSVVHDGEPLLDLKTSYLSEELGFSLEYLPGWEVDEGTEGEISLATMAYLPGHAKITIRREDGYTMQSFSQSYEEYIEAQAGLRGASPVLPASVSGEPLGSNEAFTLAYTLSYPSGQDVATTLHVVDSSLGGGYFISYDTGGENTSEPSFPAAAEEMLATFTPIR